VAAAFNHAEYDFGKLMARRSWRILSLASRSNWTSIIWMSGKPSVIRLLNGNKFPGHAYPILIPGDCVSLNSRRSLAVACSDHPVRTDTSLYSEDAHEPRVILFVLWLFLPTRKSERPS
jgi:hypothetical protein